MTSGQLPRVRILPDVVADQIAAGEVVERPASVVRELVENAIDARARHVRVLVEGGGKTLIEVSDDGHGMEREDAILALDRHATSKIATAADLVGVTTFGFRGEALPAIASVSRFALVTSSDSGPGTEIRVTGGRIDHVGDAARQPGTTVTVRGLFFNTPARRKFLRSVSSEARMTWDAVATLALAHPAVGFTLTLEGRERLQVPGGQNAEERLRAVWGRELADSMLPVEYAIGTFRVHGYIQRPADAQPTGRRTQLFINGRPFRDTFLVRAAEAGYRSAIAPGDRPSLFLHLETGGSEVDVNVHPAKLEVRFRERLAVERVLEEGVRMALGQWASAAPLRAPGSPLPRWTGGGAREDRSGLLPEGAAEHAVGLVTDLFGDAGVLERRDTGGVEEEGPPLRSFAAPLWQLFDTYIVFEEGDGLVFVDQHAAHERVLFQRIMEQLGGQDAPSQRLLLPVTVSLTDEELEVVESSQRSLERVGFLVEPFGGREVVLQGVPTPHPRFDAVACFRDLIADLARGRFGGWANHLERFAASYACRAAVKAGQRLDETEMRELLHAVFVTPLPAHDVHGRSTIVQLPRDELERRFGRR